MVTAEYMIVARVQVVSSTGKLRLARARMDLAVAIPELCEQLAPSTDPGRLRIERADLPAPVLADPGRLERILANLVTNALKYSPPETEVIVRVAREGAHAVVEVQDHGQGIAPEDLPHVFERYFRASGSSRLQGMGLGLYTARILAEAHGGTITVSSVRGEGSIFRLRLPAVV